MKITTDVVVNIKMYTILTKIHVELQVAKTGLLSESFYTILIHSKKGSDRNLILLVLEHLSTPTLLKHEFM